MEASIRGHLKALVILRLLTRHSLTPPTDEHFDELHVHDFDPWIYFWMQRVDPFLLFLSRRSREMDQHFTLNLSLYEPILRKIIYDFLVLKYKQKHTDTGILNLAGFYEEHYPGVTIQ